MKNGKKAATVIAVAAFALIAAGLAGLGYVGWEFVGTNMLAKRAHEANLTQIRDAWDRDTTSSEGSPSVSSPDEVWDGHAILRIPRFGAGWEMPVLDGFNADTFRQGVGRYVKGAVPGEVGNLVLGGHRRSRGESFRQFPTLRQGDTILVETRTRVHTYVLVEDGDANKVDFRVSWPLQPVPREGDTTVAVEPMVTLLTCAELFSSDWRYVARGVLVSSVEK